MNDRKAGMMGMLRRVRGKIPNIALGVIAGLMVGGGAFAIAQTAKPEDAGVRGGPKPRFHDARECNLVDVRSLPGNWTHGDYVSAVAMKDPSKVRDAAHSRCGKPSKSGHGKGPKQKEGSNTPSSKPSKTPKPSPKPGKPSGEPTVSPTGSSSPTGEPSATPTPTASSS